jgi:quercetin dioxygenase-like cupin family protein
VEANHVGLTPRHSPIQSARTPMKLHKLDDMVKGWFVGHFTPTVLTTDAFEVGVKMYKKGDREAAHHHKLATELTVVATGRVTMFGREFGPGDIVTVEPGESTAFEALEDTVTVVVKTPSLPNDKYVD